MAAAVPCSDCARGGKGAGDVTSRTFAGVLSRRSTHVRGAGLRPELMPLLKDESDAVRLAQLTQSGACKACAAVEDRSLGTFRG